MANIRKKTIARYDPRKKGWAAGGVFTAKRYPMPGLITTTAAVRQRMLARNLYRPDNPYDLRADAVTRTLDAFRAAGFDLRTSPLLSGLEALLDNTPMLRIAAGEITKNVLRRFADRVVHEKLPPVKLENIFSTDPAKRVIGVRPVNWQPTPQPAPTSVGEFIAQGMAAAPPSTALYQPSWPLKDRNPELEPGGLGMFTHLGEGQKAWVMEQSGRNLFNRWPKPGQFGYEQMNANPGLYGLIHSVYPAEWITKRNSQGGVYGSYLLDRLANHSLQNQDFKPVSLEQVVQEQAERNSDAARLAEGFGRITYPGTGPGDEDTLRYHTYAPGTPAEALQIERGLLRYTDALAGTDTPQGRAMRHETREFPGSGELGVVWRGSSECRTFTLSDPYDKPERLIRWDGNGVEDSVLAQHVVPRIAPQGKQDLRRLMFSIENLAWSAADLVKLPEEQRGAFGGRLMWFMPYGIQWAENASANWVDVPLMGRIEGLHNYTGSARKARLTFILLADYPDAAQQVDPTQLGAWFAGCATGPVAVDAIELLAPPLLERPAAPTPRKVENYGGVKPRYYFQNDVDTVEAGYEATKAGWSANGTIVDGANLYALNAGYSAALDDLATYVAYQRKSGNLVEITIQASASALFTNDYNARLSFRRARGLANELISRVSALGQALSVTTLPTAQQINQDITRQSIQRGTTYKALSTDGSVRLVLVGKGEELAHGTGATEGTINTKAAKKLRTAGVINVVTRSVVPPAILDPARATAEQQSQAGLRARAAAGNGPPAKNGLVGYNPRFGGSQNRSHAYARGFAQRDYLAPVFHSQTPHDLDERYQFLIQCTRPGNTTALQSQIGGNSLYGRAPVCILRLGDFQFAKVLIHDVSLDSQETKWDLNPEGMGMRPLLTKVSLDLTILGGQSLKGPVNQLLTATDFGYTAGSSFTRPPDFPANRYDRGLSSDQPVGNGF